MTFLLFINSTRDWEANQIYLLLVIVFIKGISCKTRLIWTCGITRGLYISRWMQMKAHSWFSDRLQKSLFSFTHHFILLAHKTYFILHKTYFYFFYLFSESLCFFKVKTFSLCDFEPYPLLCISLSREGCPQPKFSSSDTSEPLVAGLWVPGMKAHKVPAMKSKSIVYPYFYT